MRLTKQALQQRYSQSAQDRSLESDDTKVTERISTSQTRQNNVNKGKVQLSLDMGIGKLLTVFLMGLFMLVGPAILFENREQLVTAVINSNQTNASLANSVNANSSSSAQSEQSDRQEGRVAGLSDQAGTSGGQTLSVIFFVLGALLLTVPVFVVLRL